MNSLHHPRPFDAGRLNATERGILWPVVYASIFGSPVRSSRLLNQIVGTPVTEPEMRRALGGETLQRLVVEDEGKVWLRSGASLQARQDFAGREGKTRELLDRHHDALTFVKSMRGIRTAAISGGCAHDAADDGDIDVFAVTNPGSLWQTLFRMTMVSKARGWRRVLCLNYLVDSTAQALPWRDFYGGFELISLKPLTGESAFDELVAANPWVEPMFPNFFRSRPRVQNSAQQFQTSPSGSFLEAASRMIYRPYLRHRLPKGSGIELDDHVVRLHATDHRDRLRSRFQVALERIESR